MHRKRFIVRRQITTGALLLVFLFIHAIKLFHSHETSTTKDRFSKTVYVEKSENCEICDFHLAKDSCVNLPVFSPIPQQEVIVYIITYKNRIISSIGLSYSDRGPPSIS